MPRRAFFLRKNHKFRLTDLDREIVVVSDNVLADFLRATKIATKLSLGRNTIPRGGRVPMKLSRMSQLLFVGFPDGSHRIGTVVSVLKKEGAITYSLLMREWPPERSGAAIEPSQRLSQRHANTGAYGVHGLGPDSPPGRASACASGRTGKSRRAGSCA